MKQSLPTRKLPDRPDLDQLRRQAKELLHAFRSGDAGTRREANRLLEAPLGFWNHSIGPWCHPE